MRTGAAFNMRVVLMVFDEQGLIAVSHGFRIKYHIQGGLRRGGMTPALAPRMPTITEDVDKSRP